MRKIYLAVSFFLVASLSFASNSDLFKLDYNKVQDEFAQLDQLAQKVKTENLTYADLASTDAQLVETLALSSTPSIPLPDGALGIPSFLWGCVLGPVGIVLAYVLTDNDRDEAKKALWGCLANTAVGVIIYFVAFATAASATAGAASAY